MSGKYNKFIIALGGAAAILSSALADGAISTSEVSAVVLAFVGAVLVYLVPNKQ